MKNKSLINTLIAILAIAILPACSVGNAIYEHNQLLSNLYQYTNAKEGIIPGPINFVDHDKVLSVKNCSTFIESFKIYQLKETEENYAMLVHYIPCLSRVISSISASAFKQSTTKFDEIIYGKLDLTAFRSSFRRKMSAESTFKQLNYQLTSMQDKVEIVKQNWKYEFILIGRGEYNGDNIEDLQVVFIDSSLNGSYFAIDLLILTKLPNNKFWTTLPLIDLIRETPINH